MWIRDEEGNYLHRVEWQGNECIYLTTDLNNVYGETISFVQLAKRGRDLSLPLALNNNTQVARFVEVLRDQLRKGVGVSYRKGVSESFISVRFDLTHSGLDNKHWNFNLHALSETKCKKILAQLVLDLYGVIENLGEKLNAYSKTISDKNAVLTGSKFAALRGAPYEPTKQLEKAYNELVDPPSESRESTLLALSHWPIKLPNVLLNQPSAELDLEDTDIDSDITHDSGSEGTSSMSF